MKKSLGKKTLICPTPVVLVGTYDDNGKPNLMTAAWAGVVSSKPASIAVSLRQATHSYKGMASGRGFTVSIPSVEQVVQADYTGMASGRDRDKFAELGWQAVKSELVDAPYPEEAGLVIECKLSQMVDLGLHTQFVGEVMDVKADPAVLDESDAPLLSLLKPMVYSVAERKYYALGEELGKAFEIGMPLVKS